MLRCDQMRCDATKNGEMNVCVLSNPADILAKNPLSHDGRSELRWSPQLKVFIANSEVAQWERLDWRINDRKKLDWLDRTPLAAPRV